ncbi:MAG TPA: hypothetical protein VFV87_16335 [Pirellulaceae bacterium]|nr:hypothetical protein [Pirellulaceae bacterium]
MARIAAGLLILGLAASSSGCAMCCAPFDCYYLYQGGAWVRHNPTSGRVGSAFDEAGGPAIMEGQTLQGQPTPAPAEPEVLPMPTGTRSVLPQRRGQDYLP